MVDNSKDINSKVQKVLDTDGELPSEEYVSIADALKKKKKDYLKGNKVDKAVLKRQLNVWAQNVGAYKNFRQDLAAGYNTRAIMNTWPESSGGKAVLSLLDDKPRLVEKKCPKGIHCANKDELGVMMPNPNVVKETQKTLEMLDNEFNGAELSVKEAFEDDYLKERGKLLEIINNGGAEWTAISNLKSKIRLKDKGTRDALTNMANNYISQSSKTNPADNISFPRLAAERQVESNVIGKARNFESLIYDDMGPGPFVDNFPFKIKRETGLTSDEDAKMVADTIINDPKNKDLLKSEMKDYFVAFLHKQWQAGKANRPNPTKDSDKKQKRYIPGSLSRKV